MSETSISTGPVHDAPEPSRELVRGLRLSKFFHAGRAVGGKALLVRAVQEASVHIGAAETVGLVGESGSGKTTLGRLLLRLLEPNFGRVYFEHVDITHHADHDLRPMRRKMQLLFQDACASLDDQKTIAEVVAEPLAIHGIAADEADSRRRIQELLAMVELSPEILARRPPELSSGQCQRVSIARAMALTPRFVVCDEPLAALDVREQQRITALLTSLQRDHGHSYLLISHDLPLVLQLSQRVYVMYAGRIVESGTVEALRRGALHPYTRALMNAIPELDPRRRRLRVLLDGEPPSPFEPLVGCAFQRRCPRARPGACEREQPELSVVTGDAAAGVDDDEHRVACWHPAR